MTPSRTDVRRWYVACVALGIPWWLFLSGYLKQVAVGLVLAWIAAVLATPRVDSRRRLLGAAMSLGLTFALWLLLLIVVGHVFGDSESRGPP